MFSLASFKFPSKIVVNILVTSISLPNEFEIPLKDEMKKNLSVLHFYDNFSSPLFFQIRRKQCNKFLPRIPSISSPPPLVRNFILWHQVKLLNHTKAIIHFIPERLLVTIDFFRMNCAIITTRSSVVCGLSCISCSAHRCKNNYRTIGDSCQKLLSAQFEWNIKRILWCLVRIHVHASLFVHFSIDFRWLVLSFMSAIILNGCHQMQFCW